MCIAFLVVLPLPNTVSRHRISYEFEKKRGNVIRFPQKNAAKKNLKKCSMKIYLFGTSWVLFTSESLTIRSTLKISGELTSESPVA
jgi:hypothetical protein